MGLTKKRSKKRSSTHKLPKYTFFVDRDLGQGFCQILRNAGLNVICHDEVFTNQTTDAEWLGEVGINEWVAITHDRRIRYNPVAKHALLAANARVFVVIGHAPTSELAYNFVNILSKIISFIDHTPAPFIAKVYRPIKNKSNAKGSVFPWLK